MQRTRKADSGFTLIELMVVVMIIAVLVAIAIPTFLGFRRAAQDRGAQTELRTVLLAEWAFWLEHGDYTSTAADILSYEPASRLHPSDADLGVEVWLNASNADIVCLTRQTPSDTVFSVWESATAGTWFGATDLSGACPATVPADYSPESW